MGDMETDESVLCDAIQSKRGKKENIGCQIILNVTCTRCQLYKVHQMTRNGLGDFFLVRGVGYCESKYVQHARG